MRNPFPNVGNHNYATNELGHQDAVGSSRDTPLKNQQKQRLHNNINNKGCGQNIGWSTAVPQSSNEICLQHENHCNRDTSTDNGNKIRCPLQYFRWRIHKYQGIPRKDVADYRQNKANRQAQHQTSGSAVMNSLIILGTKPLTSKYGKSR